MANGEHGLHGPKFKWEWSLNTLALVIGFIGMAIAWGYTLAELQTGRDEAARSITEIRAELKRIEETARILDRHDVRLVALETRAGTTSTNLRTVENAINQLSSDMRLTREILQRLEQSLTAK